MEWFYNKFIVPLWVAFQKTPGRIALLVVGSVALVLLTLAALQYGLNVDVGGYFNRLMGL